MKISESEYNELKKEFEDLLNYESEDPTDPIDPLTYVAPDGDTCLHVAALRGNLRSVELLVKAGVDVNQQGDMGKTPLHYAKNKDVIECLLKNGASRSIVDEFGYLPIDSDNPNKAKNIKIT